MSQQQASAELPTAAPPADDAQYYRSVLHDLIDIGADFARMVHHRAKAAANHPDAPPTADAAIANAAIAFDRVSRSVRRTITLARKLTEPMPTPRVPARDVGQHRHAARARIIREVEDVIQRPANDAHAEALHAELLDRLDGPDLNEHLDDAIEYRSIAEIIADICRDLGIAAPPGTQPWKRRTPADITALCARAAASHSPAGCIRATPSAARASSDPPACPTDATATLPQGVNRFREQ